MNCPKCESTKTERSVKTWICYDCMHVWMHKESRQQDVPACVTCGKPARFMVQEAMDTWARLCKACYLDHISKLDPEIKEKAYELVEVNSQQMKRLLVDK